ncbi:hypothetical protein [Flavobacterium sp.]|uniref:hypothetical protein n=1 Tax=Flavobacterium sp. TaxID=239 RepID=UPI00404729F6
MCFNTFSQTLNGSGKSLLIYTEGQGYLQFYIETSIKNLINVETEEPYFSSVNSFNRFVLDNKYKAQLSDLIRTQKDNNDSSSLYYTDDEKIIRSRIFDILSNYNYFLTVNTNTLGELIEYQFQLFETIPSIGSAPNNISDNVIANENFFINPKNENCYSIIEQSLQRLFKKSNRIPEAELKIFGKTFKFNENEINLPLNTSVVFDGSYSGDFDSDNISYHWRNITRKDEKYQTSKKILFKQNLAKQIIEISDEGQYKIGFKVYDGVNYSDEVVLNINTREKPQKTILLDSIKYSIDYKSILDRRYNTKHYQTFICERLFDNDSLNRKIILSKTPLGDIYINHIKGSLIYKDYKYNYHLMPRSAHYFSKIEIESTFNNPEKKYNEHIYYFHNVDNEGLVYNERKIKHKIITREVLNFGFKFENINLRGKNGVEYSLNSPSFLLNILISYNFQLQFSIPYPSKDILYLENFDIKYPSAYNLAVQYYLFNINRQKGQEDFKPYLIFGIKFFQNANELDLKAKGSLVSSYVPGIGVEKTIKNYNLFSLSIGANLQYGFFNNKDLKDYSFSSSSIDAIFRF